MYQIQNGEPYMNLYKISHAYIFRVRARLRSLISLSLLFCGIIIILTTLISIFCPQAYTPITRRALIQLAEKFFNVAHVTNSLILTVATAVFLPYMIALMSSLVAAMHIASTVARDRMCGVFEILLSYPISIRDLTVGLTLYAISTSLVTYIPPLLLSLPISMTILTIFNNSKLCNLYITMSLLMIPATISSALVTLLVSLIAPKLAKIRVGVLTIQNALTQIGILPLLIPFIILNILPTFNPLILTLYTSITCIALSTIITITIPHIIKETNLITHE